MNLSIINGIRKELTEEPQDKYTTYCFAMLTILRESLLDTRMKTKGFKTDSRMQSQSMMIRDTGTNDMYEITVRVLDKSEESKLN